MAGIYIHIPFCKQACSYCDFHFATSLKYKDKMLEAIRHEMILAQDFIENRKIDTVYIGGGTPSLLNSDEINTLFDTMSKIYDLSQVKEWTLEANPDDLTSTYLKALKKYTPINRLSIGIQSFQPDDLKLMNRAHDAAQAEYCIPAAQDIGFENISCDLIFGTPTLSDKELQSNIEKLHGHLVPHISAYALTIEPHTPLHKKIKKAEFSIASDTHYERQMKNIIHELSARGYVQYEISNYALPGHEAIHNTNYWKQSPYWGFGPSAHAYNGHIRRWNVRNNQQYIRSILQDNSIPFESETLSKIDRINEYIMTSMRTIWGINLSEFKNLFGIEAFDHLINESAQLIDKGWIVNNNDTLTLSLEAKIISDTVISQLFII